MKNPIIITLLIFIVTTASFGQDVEKRSFYGTYYKQTGLPGRTIKQNDGSEMHLMPVVDSETFLKLKRFGRAKLHSIDNRMDDLSISFKYVWKVENDTLIIWPKGGKTEEKYVVIYEDGAVKYLESTIDERRSYSKLIKN